MIPVIPRASARGSGGRLALLVLVAGSLFLPSAPIAAQDPGLAPDRALPLDPAVRTGTLDNGLTYYVRANARPENRAELRLVVNAGSVLEEEHEQGLAHYVEHLAFRGTRNFERQALVQYLEGIGMRFGPDLNAYTSFDETVYMLTIPTDDDGIVETAFLILEDWASGVLFDPEEVERERGVVIEEWRGRRGAQARALDEHLPVMFHGSRHAERLPIGTVETLQAASADDLSAFYRRWYRPDLMAVVAVGDFDADAVEARIRETFARIPAPEGAAPRPEFPVPSHGETLFNVVTDPELTVTQIELMNKGPQEPTRTVADYRDRLVDRLYNTMLNARLQEITQRPDAPFLNALSNRGSMVRGMQQYTLAAIVPDGGAERGLEALLVESERVARHGFTGTELDRARLNLLRGLERAYDERERTNSAAYVNQYVSHYLTGAPSPGIAFELEAARALLPGIGVAEVNARSRAWASEADRVVLVTAPESAEAAPPAPSDLRGVLASVDGLEVEPYVDAVTDAPLVATPPTPGTVVERQLHPGVDIHDWTLSNGVRVLLKVTDFRDDEVVFTGFAPGGTSLAPDAEYPTASFAADVIRASGIGSFSVPELQRVLAGTAAGVNAALTGTEQRITGNASPRDLETLFQLTWLHFAEPRYDPEAVSAVMQQLRALLQNLGANPAAHFSDTLQVTLSNGHPRGRPISSALLEEVDPEAAFDFYRERFSGADGFTFVLVGNLDLEVVEPLVVRWLGGLPTDGVVQEPRDTGVRPPPGVVEKVVRRGIEPQAQTVLVFHGPWEQDRQANYALRSLSDVLSLRLRETLREDLGGTYGVQVSAGSNRFPEDSYRLQISFGADPERLEELVSAVFRELERIQEEGPTADELSRVREIQRRERETSLRQNGYWMGQIAGYVREEMAFPDILTYEALIDALDAGAVQEAARRVVDFERYVRVSLVPEG
jgi:zinc protease